MFRKPKLQSNRGFIALMSVIIIAAILLTVVTTVSFSGYRSRFNIYSSELKNISASIAEACVNTAVLKLSEDWNYEGNETLSVNGTDCAVFPVALIGQVPQVLKVQTVYQNSYTNLKIIVGDSPFGIISWQEISSLPNPP